MDVRTVSNVPESYVETLLDRDIESLYPPQAEAVEAGVTEGENVLAAVPTASGKTLIAELAMVTSIAQGGKALYIVPLRALANEKKAEFERLEDIGIDVGVATGNYESDGQWLGGKDLIVATSEKVDSLMRNDAPWIDDLSCVVADEVHLVDDGDRGPTLEVTLAKLRRHNPSLQIVALSATVGNADELATWLDATLVESDWRPIDLRTGVHYGNAVHYDDGEKGELPVRNGQRQTTAIVKDTLADDGSTLVFVNSRRNAETAARRLGQAIQDDLSEETTARLADLASDIAEDSETETSTSLANCVRSGAAFHHAGLTRFQRQAVEDAFRDRALKVIAATPTLAAGVNTPSRRVVVRDWRRYDGEFGGMAPLDTLEVHQMFGRAGRPGLDPYGEALLLASNHDELDELFDRYIWADPEPIRSKLAAEPALRTHVLATVATGFAATRADLEAFLEETLYATQTTDSSHLDRVLTDVIEYLVANEFLREEGGDLVATAIGQTVSRLYLDPMSAAEIIDGLEALTEDDRELTALGAYHLVSRTPDMYQLWLRSGDAEHFTELAYEHDDELPGRAPSEFEEGRFEDWLAALKTARLLEDWADELEEDTLTDRYNVGPGDIRGKVEVADWLLHAAEELSASLGLSLTPAISSARRRVADGVAEELLPLTGVRGVGRKRARWLYDAGIETPAALREAPKGLVLAALKGRRNTAETILDNAGRPEPSLEGVTEAETDVHDDAAEEANDEEEQPPLEDQSALGDF